MSDVFARYLALRAEGLGLWRAVGAIARQLDVDEGAVSPCRCSLKAGELDPLLRGETFRRHGPAGRKVSLAGRPSHAPSTAPQLGIGHVPLYGVLVCANRHRMEVGMAGQAKVLAR